MAARRAGLPLPANVVRALAVAEIQTRHRNETRIAELLRLASALRSRGIDGVAYKGPVIAQRYYGDAALREYVDIDLLVPEDAMPAVDRLLRDESFELVTYADEHELLRNRRKGFEESWRSRGGAVFDVHWNVSDAFMPVHLGADELLARAVLQELPGGDVRTLCDEDHLIVVAAHSARQLFRRLEWITTIGEIMVRPALDWSALVERATRARCRIVVAAACTLAARLLEYALPAAIGSLGVSARELEPVLRTVEESMLSPSLRTTMAMRRTALRLFDRRRDAMRSTLLTVFAPQMADARALPLPPAVRGAYYVLRPLRLALKYSGRLVSRIGRH